jgi:hypothetical protein
MRIYRNPEDRTIDIEGAELAYCNFSGQESKYNAEGKRNFNIVIRDSEIAQTLSAEGFNVRIRTSIDPDDSPVYMLKVTAKFTQNRRRDPEVDMIVGASHTRLFGYPLNELGEHGDDVARLDDENIQFADLTIRGWEYEEGKKSAYLVEMHAHIKLSRWRQKYAEEEGPAEEEDVPFYN